jgi:hypothetical protein
MISLSKRQRFEYTLKEHQGMEAPPVFELQPLSMADVAEIEDIVATSRTDGGGYPIGTVNRKVLRAGLVGWRNLKDAGDGGEIVFAKGADGKITDDLLVLFTTKERTELAEQLWGAAHISGDDAKN